jgi:hypothetical protein
VGGAKGERSGKCGLGVSPSRAPLQDREWVRMYGVGDSHLEGVVCDSVNWFGVFYSDI